MAGYEVGSTVQDVVLHVLGWALGGGLDGSINQAVTPEGAGKPGGPRWLEVTHKQDKLTAGWKPGAKDGKLTFWRKHPGTHVEWIEIEIAGTSDSGGTTIRKEDTGSFEGTLATIRDAWGDLYTNVPKYMGTGVDARLNPTSIADARNMLSSVAAYYEKRHAEMKATLQNLDQEEDSFRGSASEAFVQRVETAMVKVEKVQEKLNVWDTAFNNAYVASRDFYNTLVKELNALVKKYDGTVMNPHNFVLKALNGAGVESTFNQTRNEYTDELGNTYENDPNKQLNQNNDLTNRGGAGDFGGGLVTDQVGNWYTINITLPGLPNPGPFDVFNLASWASIDDQIRALWAKTVSESFPETVKAAQKLVTDFGAASALMIPPDMKPNPKMKNPNDVNGNLNIPGGGGNIPPFDWGPGPNLNFGPIPNMGGPDLNFGPIPNMGGPDLNFGGGGPNLNFGPMPNLGGPELGTGDTDLGGPDLGGPNLGGPNLGGPEDTFSNVLGDDGTGNPNLLDLNNDGIPDTEVGSGLGGNGLGPDGAGLNAFATEPGPELGVDTNGDGIPDTGDSSWATGDTGMAGLGDPEMSAFDNSLSDTGPEGGTGGGLGLGESGLPGGGDSFESGMGDGLGGGVPVPTTLGQLGPGQLSTLRNSGALDDQPLTDEMRSALAEAGLPAGGSASTLGDLTDEQLNALSDAGLLDDIPLSSADQQILSDAGQLTPQDLGDLSSSQLGALQDAGALDDVPLTGAMTDALADAGMPATGGTLGDLSPDQLNALQDAGLLDDLALTPEDQQILQDAGMLGSSTPSDLGDLSSGQLDALQDAGQLDDIPLTGAMSDALADAGMPATGGSLGDLSSEQLGALQEAGLLDDLPLTPEGQGALQDAGMLGGGAGELGSLGSGSPSDLGDLTSGQLGALQSAGALNDVPLSGPMRDALLEAGIPASGTLGDLTPEQLGALQDAGLLDDLALTPEGQQILADAGMPAGGASTLGELTSGQLGALQTAGALDGIPLTGAMTDALDAAGLPFDSGSLGELNADQLGALQDAGLLDDLDLSAEDQQILQDAGLLDSGLDLGSSPAEQPGNLGDLSSGQLGELQSSGLLDDIPVTSEQLAELQADGLLGSDTSGIDSLGDLTPAQLQDLQRAGLLDDLPLTPGQQAELGLGGDGLGTDDLGSGLGAGLGAGLGGGLGSSTPSSSGGGLGSGIGAGLLPESLGSNTPSSAFPTAIDTLDVGGGGGLGGGGGGDLGSATPLKNLTQPLSNTMPGGVGLDSGGLQPNGELAGQRNIGSLGTSMADAQAADARAAGSGMMPPMMPPMGGAPGGQNGGKERERKTWLTEDEDVWGTDPDSPAAVIGRSDDDGDAVEEPTLPGFPGAPRPSPRPDHQRRPGRG